MPAKTDKTELFSYLLLKRGISFAIPRRRRISPPSRRKYINNPQPLRYKFRYKEDKQLKHKLNVGQ